MARKIKPAIYVFCEGESEIEYANFLKKEFLDVVAMQKPVKGLFETAQSNFKSTPKYRDYASETDEIWFFFDVDDEQGDKAKWDDRLKIIKSLRKLRKSPNIRIRLLMTSACIEYWFMLHYQKLQPSIKSVADKNAVLKRVLNIVPTYKKGDATTICKIAENYKTAIENGKWTIDQLKSESSPHMNNEDALNEWLYKNSRSFSNVHEAIIYLENLKK